MKKTDKRPPDVKAAAARCKQSLAAVAAKKAAKPLKSGVKK